MIPLLAARRSAILRLDQVTGEREHQSLGVSTVRCARSRRNAAIDDRDGHKMA